MDCRYTTQNMVHANFRNKTGLVRHTILYRSFSSRMSRTRADSSYWHVGRVLPGLAAHRRPLADTWGHIHAHRRIPHRDWHSRMPCVRRPHRTNACMCALSSPPKMAVCGWMLERRRISEGRMMQQLQVNVIRDWSNGKRAEPSNCPSR